MNRKASGKHKEQIQLNGNQKLPLGPLGSSTSKKSSSSQNRGTMLAQIRDKNSSSAMAQLQPRGTESGPKIPIHTDQEDMLEDMIQNSQTYLQNHQSQPLSILNSENQLMVQKPRGGQSHQQMQIANGKKLNQQNGSSQVQQNQNMQQKRFKNTTILGPDGQDIIDNSNAAPAAGTQQ